MHLPDGHPDKLEIVVDGKKLYYDRLEADLQHAWEERNYSLENRQRYERILNQINTRNMNLKQ